jgi:type II secretory pathway pseudopilin PulG
MSLWPTVVLAIIVGIVAVAASALAYLFSVRRARAELESGLKEVRLSASRARRTGESQYLVEAEKAFLVGVGPASGQVIEVVHDLADGLSALFDADAAVDPSRICSDWYYRRTLIWLMIRPFAWLEVLRRRQSRLDQMLNTEAVRNHYRFLTACNFFEWSFSSLRIFDGIDYNPRAETAHLFYSTIRLAGESTVITVDGSERCMSYSEFLSKFGEFRFTWLGALDDLLSGMADDSDVADLRRVRLLTVYVACCSLRKHFPIPYRPGPAVPVMVDLRFVRNPVLRDRVQEQLTAWLEFHESRIRSDPTAQSP